MANVKWHGSLLTWGGVALGNVTDMETSYSDAVDKIDHTDKDDTSYNKSRPGRQKVGTITFKFNFNPDDAGWTAANTDWLAHTAKTLVLTAPSGTLATRTNTCQIMNISGPIGTAIDGLYTGSIKFKPSDVAVES